MKDRRVGTIKFSLSILENEKSRFALEQALYGIIPVRAETMYFDDTVEVTGLGHVFDEVGEGEVIPEYTIVFHSEGGEITSMEFKRV